MKITRSSLHSKLKEFATQSNGLVVGLPGSGKTYSLKELCRSLSEEKKPFFYLPIDKMPPHTTEADLLKYLEVKEESFLSFLDTLKGENKSKGIFVFDSFDSARSENAQRFYLSIARKILKKAENWNVIVSVRTYDAQKSGKLLDLFPQTSQVPEEEFQKNSISARHFFIPELTEEEMLKAIKNNKTFGKLYPRINSKLTVLLKNPFNLELVEKILEEKPNWNPATVNSEVQIFDVYWEIRIEQKQNADERKLLLSKLAGSMVEKKTLSCKKNEVIKSENISVFKELMSDDILAEVGTGNQRITFFHNIFFDYVVSKLLIEDNPKEIIKFLEEDTARPFFLRPSLSYHFTRLWYSNNDTFWNIFWCFIEHDSSNVRLFTRLIPTNVLVNELQSGEEFILIIEKLKEKDSRGLIAVKNVLYAKLSLEKGEDSVWIEILNQVSDYPDSEFLWALAKIVSGILERNSADKKIFKTVGEISIKLVESALKNLGPWGYSFCDSWGIALISKTFSYNAKKAAELLRTFTNTIGKEKFEIKPLYRIVSHIENIWESDPEFVREVYVKIFGYRERSEEKTAMGGIVVPMTSNRRQDYDSCRYFLIEKLPQFLEACPKIGVKTAINILEFLVFKEYIENYSRKDAPPQTFPFRDGKAEYRADGNYIWDAGGGFHDDEKKIADHLFTFFDQVIKKDNNVLIDEILDLFRDEVTVAVLWKRLLLTGSEYPKLFASLLFELCVVDHLLISSDIEYALNLFLEKAFSYFSKDQQKQVEEQILAIPKQAQNADQVKWFSHDRDKLLCRIPTSLLQTKEAQKIKAEIKEEIPNSPPEGVRVRGGTYTSKDLLTEKGVDFEKLENRELKDMAQVLRDFYEKFQNKVPEIKDAESILPDVKKTYQELKERKAQEPTLKWAWVQISECIETMSRSLKGNIDTELFSFCRELGLEMSKSPDPEPNEEYDSQFKYPVWSPSPRHAATRILPWLIAIHKADKEIEEAIKILVRDKVPSIRYLIATELFRLSDSSEDLFWKLAKEMAENEVNAVVNQALVVSLSRAKVKDNQDNVIEVLEILFQKALASKEKEAEEDAKEDFSQALVDFTTGIAIVLQNKWAEEKVNYFIKEAYQIPKTLKMCVFEALEQVTPHNLKENPEDAKRAMDIISRAIESTEKEIYKLLKGKNKLSEEEQTKLRNLYEVIDEVVTRLYFSMDVNESLRKNKEREEVSDNDRNKYYETVTPLLDQVLEFALNEGVLFAPTAHYFMELLNGVVKYDPAGVLHQATRVAKAGKPFSYQFDSLAVREFVKLVETLLSEYRDKIQTDKSLNDLMELIDVFAETGVSDALNFVWRLDEIYR
ncbi:MAG: hypothetical protein K9M51_01555 [Candidatus Gracilibacteria bacterium]|nr:hypothetical protein [Candidatus Gracilibacteria bacterium]